MSQALIELLHGKGAHADPLTCVEDVSLELAVRRIESFPHSIADLVFHMNYWMNYELKRIRGEKPKYPEHAAESFPPATSVLDAAKWDRLRRDMAWFIAEMIALAQSPLSELERQVESGREGDTKIAGSVEAVLWQMVAHNSYHTGQIATLRRALNVWPPQSGGDTW